MKIENLFVGAAYQSRSVNLSAQRRVNVYLETTPDQKAALYATPGTTLFATVGNGPIQGMIATQDYMYVVSGSTAYAINASGTATSIGACTGTNDRVSMEYNGTQVFMARGGSCYLIDTSANTIAAVSDVDLPSQVDIVQFMNGFFLLNSGGTNRFYITENVYDGSSINGTDYGTKSETPDDVISHIADHNEWVIFGEYSSVIYVPSENVDFPFEKMSGTQLEYGIAAKYSAAKGDNSIFWLAKSRYGTGQIVKLSGYQPLIISTRAIEYQISTYATIDDAFGYCYQDGGHTFYVLTFPTANKTWVYDSSVQDPEMAWHERTSYQGGSFENRHHSNAYCFFNGKHYVGDFQNGKIYQLDNNAYDDNGNPKNWIATSMQLPPGRYHSLRAHFEEGVGLATGQGSDPQVMLEMSDDDGHTWSSMESQSIGVLGAYDTRVCWRKLGYTRSSRVIRMSGTDPVKWVIRDADLDYDPMRA